MLVCDCNEVEYEAVKAAVRKHGNNIDAVMEEADVGTACECCLENDCAKVDLPLPLAIKRALEEI